MDKREKVIDAFRNCITEPKCEDCPWESCEAYHQVFEIPKDLALEVMKMLVMQEPRVMTLEEAQGADYCWYESRTANICILCDATMYPNLNGKPKTELQTMGTAVRGWRYDDAYGKDWRCWDKEPTKERREAEPWN